MPAEGIIIAVGGVVLGVVVVLLILRVIKDQRPNK